METHVQNSVPESELESRVEQSSMKYLSRLLRYVGGALLFGSAVAFTLQGWSTWEATTKQLGFLGFVVALTTLGTLCGVLLREDKGARTFLGVATAIVPALFAQLGAIIYDWRFSQAAAQFSEQVNASPAIATVLILGVLSVAVGTAASYLGFRTYLAPHAKMLATLFLLANLTILLPLRIEVFTASLLVIQLGVLAYYNRVHLRKSHESTTWEGYAARLTLVVPAGIILFRSLFFYTFGSFNIALCLAILAYVCVTAAVRRPDSNDAPTFCGVGTMSAGFSWVYLMYGVFRSPIVIESQIASAVLSRLEVPLFGLPFAGIILAFSFLFGEKGRGYRSFAAIVGLYTALQFAVSDGSMLSSVVSIANGLLLICIGVGMKERNVLYCGVLGVGIGIIAECINAFTFFTISPWISLAVVGVVVVSAAVGLEKHGTAVTSWFARNRAALQTWN